MTPQERQLVAELFDRLARLEGAPRDPEAEAAIADGLARAPHAVYALVQTTLVQDEALKRANARIRELEDELGTGQPDAPRERGFLDSMREALFGDREPPRGSVPSTGSRPMGVPPGFRRGAEPDARAAPAEMPERGRGGSFLGTAAAAAAGVIGGSLLLDGIRSAWGSAPHADKSGAFDAGAGESRSPWGGEGGGDLARQAGLDDVGRGTGEAGQEHGYGLLNGNDETGLAEDHDDFDLGDGSDLL